MIAKLMLLLDVVDYVFRTEMMEVVVIGGTGLIGSRLVAKLGTDGHEAVPAAPSTGVNAFTGQGLAEILRDAAVVIDVSNAPSFEPTAVLDFFETSTRNILAAGKTAGVRHYVALSVVGTDRLQESSYFRAKLAQEQLIQAGPVPYSIVRATQFFEFLKSIADAATVDTTVRLPDALIQPIAADDVASAVARIAVGPPVNGIVEVAGPERFELDVLIRSGLATTGDTRRVVSDPKARYFGAPLDERTLIPGRGVLLASTRYDDWRRRHIS